MKRKSEAVREHTPRAGGSAEDKLCPMATTRWRNPTDISGAIAWNRREFLKSDTGLSAAGAILGLTPLRAAAPKGSLIDADMGAFYTWISQQQLTGAAQASPRRSAIGRVMAIVVLVLRRAMRSRPLITVSAWSYCQQSPH
jgi:hypothetical protein